MEFLTHYLMIDYTLVSIVEYRLSLIELLGIISGLVSVYFAARMNIWTWTSGLVNEAIFFSIFHQVQLYSDMFLQIFFATITVYGWWRWRRTKKAGALKSCKIDQLELLGYCAVVGGLAVFLGVIMSNIHKLFPELFQQAAAFPFVDSLTSAASIVATILLVKGVYQSWYFWIFVDLLSIGLYLQRGIPFMGLLYFIFLVLAIGGLVNWQNRYCYD